MFSYECGGHADRVWSSSTLSYHLSPLGCGGAWWRRLRMGTCAPVRCLPRSVARRIYYISTWWKAAGERAEAGAVRPHVRRRERYPGERGRWGAMRARSSRTFYPYSGRQAGLWYFPAHWRDTTNLQVAAHYAEIRQLAA